MVSRQDILGLLGPFLMVVMPAQAAPVFVEVAAPDQCLRAEEIASQEVRITDDEVDLLPDQTTVVRERRGNIFQETPTGPTFGSFCADTIRQEKSPEFIKKHQDLEQFFLNSASASGAVGLALGATPGFGQPVSIAFGIAAIIDGLSAARHREIWMDPPDPNFTELAILDFEIPQKDYGFGSDVNNFLNGFEAALNEHAAALIATLQSLERRAGAADAGDLNFFLLQSERTQFFEDMNDQTQHNLGVWYNSLPDFFEELGYTDILLNDPSLGFSAEEIAEFPADSIFALALFYGDELTIDGFSDPDIPDVGGGIAEVPIPGALILFMTGLFGLYRFREPRTNFGQSPAYVR